jgi:tetrahydromethanopterin S-methyltransferase subunit A
MFEESLLLAFVARNMNYNYNLVLGRNISGMCTGQTYDLIFLTGCDYYKDSLVSDFHIILNSNFL